MTRDARPRRLLACAASVAVALLGAGCGGDGGERTTVSPALRAALSYLPRDAALAVAVPTDPDRAPVRRLLARASRLEGWSELEREFERQIAGDLDFDRDVEPQLGDPLVFSASRLEQDDDQQVTALRVRDPRSLRRVVERQVAEGRRRRLSDYKGALVTRDTHRAPGEEQGSDFSAIHRNVLVQADSEARLRTAIDRSAGEDNLARNAEVALVLDQLGEDVLFRLSGDTGKLLERSRDRSAALARRLDWVAALGELRAAAFVTPTGVRFAFEQETDRRELSERDLPLAAGAEPALLHDRRAPIAIGLREPDRLYAFIESALEVGDPRRFREYDAAIRQLRALGTDVHDDVLARVANLSLALRSERNGTFQAALAEGAGRDLRRFLELSEPFLEGVLGGSQGRVRVAKEGTGEDAVWTVEGSSAAPRLRYRVPGDTLVGAIGGARLGDPVEGAGLPEAEGALGLSLSGARFAELVRELDSQGSPDLADAQGRRALRLLATITSLRLSMRAETSVTSVVGELLLPRPRQ